MKKSLRSIMTVLAAAVLLVVPMVFQASAVGPKVSEPGNRHNLSATNVTNPYHAMGDSASNPRGQQVCIFCHTPHSANVAEQAPLWNRKFSSEVFQRYSGSTTFQIKNLAAAQYVSGSQPNGSSKLCLSCHDGVSRLGAVYNGPEIPMTLDVISGRASFKPSTNKMKSGHHPVSFVYNAAVRGDINLVKTGYALPDNINYPEVKLDKQGRMQCTTCHDAHQNQSHDDQCYPLGAACGAGDIKIAPFWVYGRGGSASTDQQTVCTTCHPMSEWPGFTRPLSPP